MQYDLTKETTESKLAIAREQLDDARHRGEVHWVAWYEYVIRSLEEILANCAQLDG